MDQTKTALGVIVLGLSAFILADMANEPPVPLTPAKYSTADIDALVERARETFQVPGISVSIVQGDEVIFAKGYGVKSVDTNDEVWVDSYQLAHFHRLPASQEWLWLMKQNLVVSLNQTPSVIHTYDLRVPCVLELNAHDCAEWLACFVG